MYKVWIAYLLWLLSGFGCLGFHRFYLGKVPTGVLWFFTGGMFFLGALFDFFTLGNQVALANFRTGSSQISVQPGKVTVRRAKMPLERTILRLAEKNKGRVSAVVVAASSDWTVDEAQKRLDQMARQGVCELVVLKSGNMVYRFPDLDPAADQEAEV